MKPIDEDKVLIEEDKEGGYKIKPVISDKDKKCVACKGTGKSTSGNKCPICEKNTAVVPYNKLNDDEDNPFRDTPYAYGMMGYD